MSVLKDKVAIVLGAAGKGNMGQAIARTLAANGATVVLGGRGRDRMEVVANEIGGACYECDITKKPQVAGIVSSRGTRWAASERPRTLLMPPSGLPATNAS